MPARRHCGLRIAGGLYWELSAWISNIDPGQEHRQLDPEAYVLEEPVPIDTTSIGLASLGVKYIERNGVWHILDWVGEQHYATPEVFLDEVRRLGLSRRIPRTRTIARLSRDSMILLVHRHACGQNRPGIFMRAPLGNIGYITDTADMMRNERQFRATRSTLPALIPLYQWPY